MQTHSYFMYQQSGDRLEALFFNRYYCVGVQIVQIFERSMVIEMSKRETYETRTEQLLLPIAQEAGVEIYDVEYVKEGSDWYLRAYIDKPEGVNINDCETVSRALSDKLDEQDFIDDAYILEVSSPGLGRTLKKDKHLEKSLGEEVEIRLYKPVDKCKDFAGILKRFDSEQLVIETAEKEMTFARKEIALIRLALDF